MRREFTFCEIESILLIWHLQVPVSHISVDGNILCEKSKQIADRLQIDNLLHKMNGPAGSKIIMA
jgi:hypothetical protein